MQAVSLSDGRLSAKLAAAINREVVEDREYRIMEVCGTHTMSIARFGIKSLIPKNVQLLSGPGCPVCVTPQRDIDDAVALSRIEGVTTAVFGDMMRLKSSNGSSLLASRAEGGEAVVVYSPLDVISLAKARPDRQFVFLAVGFETTTPMAAGLLKSVLLEGLLNITLLSMGKTMPKALQFLLEDKEIRVDGFLCPGHVSVITGTEMYEPIACAGKSAVITGFEAAEILSSILEIVRQVNRQDFKVVNNYKRAVKEGGNARARALVAEYFTPCDAEWRGLGRIRGSGLAVREKYGDLDAEKRFPLPPREEASPTPCRCGDILKGRITPELCPLFGKACTPDNAVGPCMVSSEGACAAWYKYNVR